jgi:DNA topoisomerase I
MVGGAARWIREQVSTGELVGAEAASAAGLHYVDDSEPGYTRRRHGRGFVYLDHRGRALGDAATVDRLRGLVVPPAWTDVWFCRDPQGHIQATGRDARDRKQYRYHDDWQRTRDEAKFDSLVGFGHALPALRERVDADMRQHNLSFERVVATTVWLLDHTLIRIGNNEYARADDSYGLTTLRNKHVDVGATTMRFRFTGKSGKPHDVVLHDRRVARTVARCQELPGQQLFQYVVDDSVRGLDSRDVNAYIRDVTSTDFTAKTFRTWGGSVLALDLLRQFESADSPSEAKRQAREALKATARQLRNTPAVCRRSYVHPLVLEAHADGQLHDMPKARRSRAVAPWLTAEEATLVALLERDR